MDNVRDDIKLLHMKHHDHEHFQSAKYNVMDTMKVHHYVTE